MKKEVKKIKSVSTFFARLVVYLTGIAAIGVLSILLPELAREETVGKPNPHIVWLFLGIAYIVAAPFFIALYQTNKLLGYIDQNNFFTDSSITAIRNIKKCAIVFGILVVGAVICGTSLSRMGNPREDVTFMFTIGIVLTSISGIIAVFVAVLQKLLADAVSLKSENDLIV